MSIHNTPANIELSARIAAETAAFLARGGSIRDCHAGQTGMNDNGQVVSMNDFWSITENGKKA